MSNKPSIAYLLVLAFLTGCQPAEKVEIAKKPRPVEVKKLVAITLDNAALVTATVGSWKTEQIGMEVGGRIESVVEPNTDIEGRYVDENGIPLSSGTRIARIDNERYQLQVESAEAQVAQVDQAIRAANIQIDETLVAQLAAATAEKNRAKTEFDRSRRLVEQRAGAQSDVDRDEAAFLSAQSQIKQIESNINAQKAELESLKAQRLQAEDALREAQRSLRDCELYSSFPGQISEIFVVPGSVVSAGQAVATIQMMDPIKVEVEVTADDTRRLRNRQRLPVMVQKENGVSEEKDGFLYLVDQVADPNTRTFTLTLLMMNDKISEDERAATIPTTRQTWRVDFPFLPGASDGLNFVNKDAILNDEEGPYVLKVLNMEIGGGLPPDRILKIKKTRIEEGDLKVPFLGNWIFQQVNFVDQDFDRNSDLICARINLPDGLELEDWSGDEILFQNEGQWELRPGDLVRVDISDNVAQSGIFVPMDAIAYEADRTFLFLLSETGSPPIVERVEILIDPQTNNQTSAILSVRPAATEFQLEGRKYVSRGAHYLVDGEQVRPVESEDAK